MPEKQPHKDASDNGYDWEEDVMSYVLGELPQKQRDAFEVIMQDSSLCRLKVFEVQQLLGTLQDIPPSDEVDLLPGILDELERQDNKVSRIGWLAHIRKVAAVLILIGGSLVFWLHHTLSVAPDLSIAVLPEQERVVGNELQWLAESQQEDGSWVCQNNNRYSSASIGITALALLAFLNNDQLDIAAQYKPVVERGLAYLLQQQNQDGSFGPVHRAQQHNSRLAHVALQAAQQSGTIDDIQKYPGINYKRKVRRYESSESWAYTSPRHTRAGSDRDDIKHIVNQLCQIDYTSESSDVASPDLPACRNVYTMAMRALAEEI